MNKNSSLRWAIFFFIAFFFVAVNLNDVSVLQNDSNVGEYVIDHQISWLNSVCSVLSFMFEPIYVALFIFLLGLFLWIKKYRDEAIFFIFASSVSGALIYLLKHIFVRARPIVQFLAETGYSFPSGHALISVVLFGSLIYFSSKIKSVSVKICLISFSILGILILGLSRVYLNVHWFSDILGGYFLGSTILFFGIFLYQSNIFQKLVNLFYPK
jgi:undecaprenyl-diphosphatase